VSEQDHTWRDSVAAYLLGALPEDEVLALRMHLDGCATCRRTLDDLRPAVDALPAAVTPLEAPPALRDRIMAIAESEAELLHAAGPDSNRTPARRARPRRSLRARLQARVPGWLVAAPVAACLLLAVAVGVLATGDEGVRSVTASVDRESAPAGRARLEIGRDGTRLVAQGLPDAPGGRVYQVWLKRSGETAEPTSALFAVRSDGSASVSVPGSLEGIDQVLVTAEPRGGSDVPSRQPLVQAFTS